MLPSAHSTPRQLLAFLWGILIVLGHAHSWGEIPYCGLYYLSRTTSVFMYVPADKIPLASTKKEFGTISPVNPENQI